MQSLHNVRSEEGRDFRNARCPDSLNLPVPNLANTPVSLPRERTASCHTPLAVVDDGPNLFDEFLYNEDLDGAQDRIHGGGSGGILMPSPNDLDPFMVYGGVGNSRSESHTESPRFSRDKTGDDTGEIPPVEDPASISGSAVDVSRLLGQPLTFNVHSTMVEPMELDCATNTGLSGDTVSPAANCSCLQDLVALLEDVSNQLTRTNYEPIDSIFKYLKKNLHQCASMVSCLTCAVRSDHRMLLAVVLDRLVSLSERYARSVPSSSLRNLILIAVRHSSILLWSSVVH